MACRRGRRQREDERAQQQEALNPSGPHFFKIILSDTLESGKLRIPKSFLRRYAKDLSGVVLLKVPGNSTWPVKLENTNSDKVWLSKGLQKFMEHYSIGHNHLLVFKYEGDSIFHVIIFDKSASEIDYPSSIQTDVLSPKGESLSRKEENVMEIEDSEGSMLCSWPSSNGSSRKFGGLRPLTALELSSQFKSVHPFFKVVMQPTCVQRRLSVPRGFFRKHVQQNKQIATLKYSNRSWQVKLKSYDHRDMAFLTTGWSLFTTETGLHVGDVCMFELIDRDDIVFRASIFSSYGRIQIEQSQCRGSSSEPAFHSSPSLSPVTAHEQANQFESELPFFNIVILPNHINRKLNISWEFIKTYIWEDQRMATLVYSDRSWEVKLWVYQRFHVASLTVSWSAFTREACPHKGDVCVFELINRDDILFRVSIFRSADKEVICID